MPDIKDLIERSKVLTLIEEIRVSPHWSGAVTDMLTDVIAGEVRELPAASALSRLEKENAELREALRPFGEFGQMMLKEIMKDESMWVLEPDDTPVWNLQAYGFNLGHFRAAARALTKESIDAKG